MASKKGTLPRIPVRRREADPLMDSYSDLAQGRVDLFKRGRPGAEVFGFQGVERRIHRAEVSMQIFRLRIDIEQPGDDLALGGMPCKKRHGADAIVRVIVSVDLAQR